MRYPFNASAESISIFFNHKMHSIPATDAAFPQLSDHLKLSEHDYDIVLNLIDKPAVIARLTEGKVTVIGDTVYYNGGALISQIHDALSRKLVSMLDGGYDAAPWARFIGRVMANPTESARDGLYKFLERFNAPITEDGHFLGFKRVRGNYFDIHSNTMDNSPGNIVQIDRALCNDDPEMCNSGGLHVAATSYLGSFYASTPGYRVIVVKIDPADVVAVPPYNETWSKMRVCRYLVLGDAEEQMYKDIEKTPLSYVGTAPATGPITDSVGHPVCYNANDFAENWRRDANLLVEEGVLVTPSSWNRAENSPENAFLVGRVESFGLDEDSGQSLVRVLWQDGAACEYLHDVDPAKAFVVPVVFIGDVEEDPSADNDVYVDDTVDDWTESEVAEMGDEEDEDDDLDDEDDDLDDEEDEFDDPSPTELAFTRNGITYSASAITEGLRKNGQRGYSRLTGVPRTTLQEWAAKING